MSEYGQQVAGIPDLFEKNSTKISKSEHFVNSKKIFSNVISYNHGLISSDKCGGRTNYHT